MWSSRDPHLYDVDIELLDADGAAVDRVTSYTGLRGVTIDGQAIKINGEVIFQRLVLDQGYYPDGIMTAPEDEALRRDIELSLAAGFNGARLHQKVFEELVYIAIEIANEGREGRPVGTTFVLGDSENVLKYSQQMVLNPFKGYSEKHRIIYAVDVRETVKEFAQLDGAFVIRKDGIIESAGAFLKADLIPEKLPQGWGARHYSAAAITNVTNALAITVSQSSGDVRIFKGGIPIIEIEKPLQP